jgi:hypothetical protein
MINASINTSHAKDIGQLWLLMRAQDHITIEANSAAVTSNWNEHCNEWQVKLLCLHLQHRQNVAMSRN